MSPGEAENSGTGGKSNDSGGSVSSGGASSSGGAASGGTTASSGGTTASSGGTTASSGGTTASSGGTTAGSGGATASSGGSTTSDSGGATAAGNGGRTGRGTGGNTASGTGGSTASGTGGSTASGKGGSTASGKGGSTASGKGGSTASGKGGSTASGDGYPLGNPAVPSEGCGKALSTFKTGTSTIKMTSASINREYIIAIPSDYDQDKPYRLVFGMHCMGSSATQCANNDKYYRLQPLDTGKTTIFVAPQGYTDSWPWRGNDDKDHVFFEDMVKKFQSELCIDNSRIFSVGFSFGAMFTNALAQTHQSTLRGVVVYATADYNIYFPKNTGEPLAYMGVHGTADGTCPFSSGKSSIERFVKNNKCTVPSKVPEATSSTHVVYDYECPENYPVKWCTHNGGHTDLPKDPGQSTSWDIDLTWKFITQF